MSAYRALVASLKLAVFRRLVCSRASDPAMSSHHSLSPAPRTALIAVVLLALALMQWLGAVHRVVHFGPMASALHAVAPVVVKTPASASGGFFKSLFAGHDQDGTCDIYDQLSHADALWSVPTLAVVVQAPVEPVEVHRSWHLAAQSTGFLARGPPALS